MISLFELGSALALLSAMIAVALYVASQRSRRVRVDQPPGLLAQLVARQAPQLRMLSRPGILADSRTAIERCRACAHASDCSTWVIENRTGRCPTYCPNAGFLGRLSAP